MRFLFFASVVFLFYAGICFFMGTRLLVFIRCFLPSVKAAAFWIPFAFLCCAVVVNIFRHNSHLLRQAGLIGMAVLLYLLSALVLSEILRLLLFLFGKKIQNYDLYAVGASLLLCAILVVFGVLNARLIKTVNYNVTLEGRGSAIRAALVSDLHIGASIGKPRIEKIVDTINGTQSDIVFIAGDIFDGNLDAIQDLPDIAAQLKRINVPLGAYAVLGNHDVDRTRGDTQRIEEFLKAAGVTLLQDESRTVRENLHIAGRKDARPIGMNSSRKTPQELCAGLIGTIIMLDHQPTQFAQIEKAGAALVLSGHTHRGQVFPGNLLMWVIYKAQGATHYGYWRGQTMQAVVTSGAGYWGPPLRVGTNSEVAVIDINFMQ